MNGGIVSEYCAPMAVPPCFLPCFLVCCRLHYLMSSTVIYAISVQLTTSCYLIRYAVNCVIMIYCSDVSGTAAVARHMTPRDLLDRAGAARSMCARYSLLRFQQNGERTCEQYRARFCVSYRVAARADLYKQRCVSKALIVCRSA